jgi:adenine-specific DNA-methyltransferase
VARVCVLYIADETVGPHLELLRSVCEPMSESRPHVTVRYFDKLPVPPEYYRATVSSIDLIEPGSFGDRKKEEGRGRTVFIRCRSDDLMALEHKPHYPESDFHVTIYDGKSTAFAKALLRVLARFNWGVRVPLPYNTALTTVTVRVKRSSRRRRGREFSEASRTLFRTLTSQELDLPYLMGLSDRERLRLVRTICDHLIRVTSVFDRVRRRERRSTHALVKEKESSIRGSEVHLTPPELAHSITKLAVGFLRAESFPVEFGDPAVGTGAFYAALLQILDPRRISSAIGIDINPRQVAAARWRWSDKGMQVLRGDYLHMERLPPRNLILANPPYLRHQRIPQRYKQELRARASVSLGARVSALSGQYVYFLLLSHSWMKEGAVAAWLIPSEFMQTRYGRAVRHYLTEKVQLLRVHQFGHDVPQFENAQVLPAVVVFRNLPPVPGGVSRLSAGGTLDRPLVDEVARIEDLHREDRWSIPRREIPRRSGAIRLGDLFLIRRGIATGANDFFVMERDEAARLGIPRRALRPIFPKARSLETDIIEREPDGYPAVRPQLCVLDTEWPESQIREKHPRLFKYLQTGKARGILSRNLIRRRNPWYKQERREPAPFLCTYMGRGSATKPPLRFLWNKSDAIATNTYLMLYPRPRLAALLQSNSDTAAALFALLQETWRENIDQRFRIHAGGLRKIEPSELLDTPLTIVPAWLVGLPMEALELDLLHR